MSEVIEIKEFEVDVNPDDLIRIIGLKRRRSSKAEELKQIILNEIPEIKKLIEPLVVGTQYLGIISNFLNFRFPTKVRETYSLRLDRPRAKNGFRYADPPLF